ncbi:MAG: outer membrane protein [Methylocella sp.]
MYRKFLLASVGAISLTGSAALAADLPSRAPPPVYLPPPPIFTWTGIYIGGQVGYAWSNGSNHFAGFLPDGTVIDTSAGGTPNGVIGGGHVGFNYQINQWVIGLEGSVDGTSLSNTAVAAFPDGSTLTAHSTADIQGSIRGRLGVAWDRALIYATGGVAFGGFNTDVSIADPAVPFFATANRSNTRVGWTVGGGIEYAITNDWWVRAEYRFTDFGNIRDGTGIPPIGFFNEGRRLQQNQVQVGFSYRFNLGAPYPVVAKY